MLLVLRALRKLPGSTTFINILYIHMVRQILPSLPNYLNVQHICKGADTVKFIKSLRLRLCGLTERMNNERMPKQIVIARTEEIREGGNPWKRWNEEVEVGSEDNGNNNLA